MELFHSFLLFNVDSLQTSFSTLLLKFSLLCDAASLPSSQPWSIMMYTPPYVHTILYWKVFADNFLQLFVNNQVKNYHRIIWKKYHLFTSRNIFESFENIPFVHVKRYVYISNHLKKCHLLMLLRIISWSNFRQPANPPPHGPRQSQLSNVLVWLLPKTYWLSRSWYLRWLLPKTYCWSWRSW